MLAKEDFVAPIPKSLQAERIREKLGAADVELSAEEFAKVAIHCNRPMRTSLVPEKSRRS
jgi:diketogulonate reductase-like aldo/keto reductase